MQSKKLLMLSVTMFCCLFILNFPVLCNAQTLRKNQELNLNPVKQEQNVTLLVDIQRRRLIVFQGTDLLKSYPVAVGKNETPSPIGNWRIQRKAKNWGSGFGARYLDLSVTWGKYGIHGTNKPWSIGTKASHGCIRMRDQDVIELYELVSVGTAVIIVGNPFGPLGEPILMHQGHKGAQVVLLQQALARLGYYEGSFDGIFGYGTERALKAFQKDFKLEVSGQVKEKEFRLLNL